MPGGDVILSVSGLTKSYGAQRPALSRVSFDLHAGEVLCLVGENGAGKSTLIKILSGAVSPDAGSVTLGGRSFSSLTPREAMGLGVATIYQDVELIDSLTVADNIFLGAERRGGLPFTVDARGQARAARDYLDLIHIDIDEDALVEDLSAAQKQNLQIAKALHREARVLIMDEPTSSLGYEEKRSLMNLIRELKGRGIGIVYISHYLEEVFEIGDTILVLKDGEQVGIHARDQVDMDFVIRSMVGRDASAFFRRERVALGPVRVQVRGMRWSGMVEDVSFEVRAGEVFGIGGLVGSGRSELVSLIFGAARRDAGEVRLDGKLVAPRRPADAIRHRHLPHHRGSQEARHVRAAERARERDRGAQRDARRPPARPRGRAAADLQDDRSAADGRVGAGAGDRQPLRWQPAEGGHRPLDR